MALIDDLVSYWPFDEASGNAVDVHGSNDLTNNNGATFGAGKINNGADLEAGSVQTFSIADGSQVGLDFAGDLTFAAWVNFETVSGSGIISKFSASSGTDRAYNFHMASSSSIALRIVQTAGAASSTASVSWTPSTGTWYHVVVTKSGTTCKFYVDGAQQGADQTFAFSDINDCTVPFFIGCQESDGSGAYDGKPDEVGVWSRAISSGEVAALYNGGAGLAYPLGGSPPPAAPTDALMMGHAM